MKKVLGWSHDFAGLRFKDIQGKLLFVNSEFHFKNGYMNEQKETSYVENAIEKEDIKESNTEKKKEAEHRCSNVNDRV